MELIAVVRALEPLPLRWSGKVHTDSRVTICRLKGGFRPDDPSVPDWLRSRCFAIRCRITPRYVHVGGHPTRKELREGRKAGGLPCSKWNVLCDEECRRRAEENRAGILKTG